MILGNLPRWWTGVRGYGAGVVVVWLHRDLGWYHDVPVVPGIGWANPGKDFMANAVSGFSRIPAGQVVLNQGVPFDLIHPALMALRERAGGDDPATRCA